MYFSLLFKRLIGVIFTPASTWKEIKTGQDVILELLIFLLLICCSIGWFSSINFDLYWAPNTFIPFVALLASSISIRFISSKMRGTDWKGSIYLIVFSAVPLLASYACSLFFGGRLYLLPVGALLSLLVLILGLRFLLDLKSKELLLYTSFCIFTVILCFYLSLNLLAI